MRELISMRKYLLLPFFLLLSAQVGAQCLVNSLTVNTGYNPVTGTALAGGSHDPKWSVSYITAPCAAICGCTAPYQAWIIPPLVLSGYTWATNPNSGWINFYDGTGYATDNTSSYYAILSREFRTCGADSVRLNFQIANDNFISNMNIDGGPVLFSQAGGFTLTNFTTFTAFTTTVYLAPGTHTLNVTEVNYAQAIPMNAHGLNIVGTIASTTGINSLVKESDTTCNSYVCAAPPSPCDTITLADSVRLCYGGSTILAPSIHHPDSITSVIWTPTTGLSASYILNPTVTPTATTTYTVTVNEHSCTLTDTIRVIVIPTPVVNLGPDTGFCSGGSSTLSSPQPPGYTYLWSTGSTASSISVSSSGSYWLQVSNSGCTDRDTVNISVYPTPAVYLGRDTTFCVGDSLALHVTEPPGSTYLWSTGATTKTIPVFTSGSYWLVVSNHGCSAADTINVTVAPGTPVHLGNDTTFCEGGSITLSSPHPPGYTYAWSTGSSAPTITVNTSGVYWLIAYDSVCTSRDTIVVTVNQFPPVDLGNDTSLCTGLSLPLSSMDAYVAPSYTWSTGAHTASINVTTSGTYSLSVTVGGCTTGGAINVSFKPLPVVNLGPDAAICNDQPLILSSPQPAGAQYLWNTGSTSSSITIAQAGTYGVFVTVDGCSASDSIVITDGVSPSVNLGRDTTVCIGSTIQLSVGGQSASYLWSDGSTGSSLQVSAPGIYWVQATNLCGTASDTVQIDYNFCDIWLPTAFTPNNDGKNDLFKVLGSLSAYSDFVFSIYNRWGEVVFTTKDISKGWDGIFNGVPQEIGTYMYYVTFTLNGSKGTLKGNLQLIR